MTSRLKRGVVYFTERIALIIIDKLVTKLFDFIWNSLI